MDHDTVHSDPAVMTAHAHAEEHHHPQWGTYKWVALVLFVITVAEVWAYYIPSFVASRAFVPTLLTLSGAKFAIVVMFYMHLKYDHKLFRVLFTGPLLIAATLLMALLFLFGQVVANFGPSGPPHGTPPP
ncbi:MAG TPA: cytochrome C oxidase subunit IV family protein [Gemmatimonadaceae bacterium]|jgi:cytochrome c oxidase subunit 4